MRTDLGLNAQNVRHKRHSFSRRGFSLGATLCQKNGANSYVSRVPKSGGSRRNLPEVDIQTWTGKYIS
jgi:hypothetical protein